VQETLRSVITQTYPNIELIVANDGSADSTHEKIVAMLPPCRERFRRVEYINKANEGFIKTLNLCLSMVRGDYIYIIASDDLAAPSAVEVLHDFLCRNAEYGLVVGDNAIIDANGIRCYWGRKREIIYEKEKAFAVTFADYLRKFRPEIDFTGPSFGTYESLLGGNHVPNGYLIRKLIIDRFGGYSEQAPLDDWYLMLQISKYSKLKFIDQILFYYRWHATNTIRQRGKIEAYYEQTLRMEIPYATEHGFGAFIPKTHTVKFLSIKLFYYRKTSRKTVLRILGITLYKRTRGTVLKQARIA